MTAPIAIDIIPMGAVRVTQGSRWTPRAQRYEAYKTEIRLKVGGRYQLPPALSLEFTIPMPKSWSKKKRANALGKPHQSRPDVDNLAKGFMDAFGVEDSHVWQLNATKRWGETGRIVARSLDSGVRIEIYETPPPPQVVFVRADRR